MAACSADSSTAGPGQNSAYDLSSVVIAATASDMNYQIRILSQMWPLQRSPAIDATRCPFSVGNQDFECAPLTIVNVIYKTSYVLLDAGGRAVTTASGPTIDGVRATLDITSHLQAPSGDTLSIVISRHSVNTLSGILSGLVLLNGTAVEHDTLSFARSVQVTDAATTTTNYHVPMVTGLWPMAGTIGTNLKTTIVGDDGQLPSVLERDILATFNGTNMIPATLTTNGIAQRCTIDLTMLGGISCS